MIFLIFILVSLYHQNLFHMGQNFTQLFFQFFSKQQMRTIILGMDAVGKTTILYKLKLGQTITSIPTIGFNVQSIPRDKANIVMWDVGGGSKIRMLWRHYYPNTQLIIFVVDSTDKERINEAKEQLHKILQEQQLTDVPLLLFANKQDIEGCMTVPQITEKMSLHTLKYREWYIQGSSAVTGFGLEEGIHWGIQNMLKKKSKK